MRAREVWRTVIEVGDRVCYGGEVWTVIAANACYLWLVHPSHPTWAPLRVERDKVQIEPREAERGLV